VPCDVRVWGYFATTAGLLLGAASYSPGSA
jgi:hypothetical protein